MAKNAVELINVSYSIPQGFLLKSKNIVKNLSIQIPRGESMGLIGPNGAGKTTTIKLCTGIVLPKSGRALINGNPTDSKSSREKLGLLTEKQYISGHLKVKEWLCFMGRLSGLSGNRLNQAVEANLTKFHLDQMADRAIFTLSKGQVQRIGFAQAFLHDPDILILDEPMSGMDPLWRSRIHDILLDCKARGKSILFSSHIMSDVLQLSDSITAINHGRIKWQGTMKQIEKNISQYQVVVHAPDIEKLKQQINGCRMESQPDKSVKITADGATKDRIIEMAADKALSMTSLTPVYPGIEEIFK